MATNTGEGTKDVTQAQIRTDIALDDTLLLVNRITKEVQQVEVGELMAGASPDGEPNAAPAFYDDFFGL